MNLTVATYAPRLKICLSPNLQYESLENPARFGPASEAPGVKQIVNESLIHPGLDRLRLARDALIWLTV